MKHQERLPVIFLSKDDPGLTSCYLIGRLNFAKSAFLQVRVKIVDFRKILEPVT